MPGKKTRKMSFEELFPEDHSELGIVSKALADGRKARKALEEEKRKARAKPASRGNGILSVSHPRGGPVITGRSLDELRRNVIEALGDGVRSLEGGQQI